MIIFRLVHIYDVQTLRDFLVMVITQYDPTLTVAMLSAHKIFGVAVD